MKGGITLADMQELNELMNQFDTFEETKEAIESRFPGSYGQGLRLGSSQGVPVQKLVETQVQPDKTLST